MVAGHLPCERRVVTTVVGLARDGAVYMAADSMTNAYERPISNGARKILRLPAGGNGEALIGVTGSGGLPGVIAAELKIFEAPSEDQDPQPWAHTIARDITKLALDSSLAEDGHMSGTVLFGWGGRLWTLTHAMAIPHEDGIAAVGSGEGPAIGAVDALLVAGMTDLPQIVARAVAIGINRDRCSGGPIQVEMLPA